MKNIKKTAAILILATFLFQIASPAMASGIKAVTDLTQATGGTGVKAANTIYFGNFWQESTASKSDASTRTPIAWKVIATGKNVTYDIGSNTNATGSALELISDKLLYASQFASNTTKNYIQSEVRLQLTGGASTARGAAAYENLTNSFAKDALSEREYNALLPTEINVYNGNTSTKYKLYDKLYLPDKTTVEGTTVFKDASDKGAKATEFSTANTLYDTNSYAKLTNSPSSTKPQYMWTRDKVVNSCATVVVPIYASSTYSVGKMGNLTTTNHTGAVRPMTDIKAENVLFLTAATGGKSCSTVGAGFALSDYSGTEFVMTLKDSTIAAPTVEVWSESGGGGEMPTVDKLADEAAPGSTVDLSDGLSAGGGGTYLNYSGAATGTNMYLSALVAPELGGGYQNYAKLASTESAASGNHIQIITTGLEDGTTYRLYVFSEEANGDYQTDFASAFATFGSADYTTFTAGGGGGGDTCYSGTLSSGYKDKPLTMAVGGTFNLSFEDGVYQTSIDAKQKSDPKNYATITAGSNGTTLQSIAVNGAKLNASGNFTLAGDLAVNSGSLWIGDTPNENDKLTVGGSASVAASANLVAAGALTLNGADNTINGVLQSGTALSATGDLSVGSAGKVELLANSSGTIGGNVDIAAGGGLNATGALNVGGNMSVAGTGDIATSGYIFTHGSAEIGGNLTVAAGGYFNATGDLTVNGTGSCSAGYLYANSNLTINGSLDVANTADVRTLASGSSFNVNGDLTLAGGTTPNSARITVTAADSLGVAGNLTVGAGTATNSGAMLSVAGGLTVGGDLNLPYGESGVYGNTSGAVNVAAGGLTVGGNLALEVLGTATAAAPLTVAGDVEVGGDFSITRGKNNNFSSSKTRLPFNMTTTGAALTVGGTLGLVNNTSSAYGAALNTPGALTVGAVGVGSNFTLNVASGSMMTITGHGESRIENKGKANALGGLTLAGSGMLNVANGGEFNVTGDLASTGGGSLDVAYGGKMNVTGGLNTTNGGSISVGGTMYLGGNVNADANVTVVSGGKLCQTGTNHCNTFGGSLNITGGFTMNGSLILSGEENVIGGDLGGTISSITLNNGGSGGSMTNSKLTIASGKKVCTNVSKIDIAGNLATLENNGSVYAEITNSGNLTGTGSYYKAITNSGMFDVDPDQLIGNVINDNTGTVTFTGGGNLTARLSGAGTYSNGYTLNVSDIDRLDGITLANAGVVQLGDTTERTLTSTVTGGKVNITGKVAADVSKIDADVTLGSSTSYLRLTGGSEASPAEFGHVINGSSSATLGIGGGASDNGAGSYVKLNLANCMIGDSSGVLPKVGIYGASTLELTDGALNSTISQSSVSSADKNGTVIMAEGTTFAAAGNITGYKAELNSGIEFTATNLSDLWGFKSNNAVFKLSGSVGAAAGGSLNQISVDTSHTGGSVTGDLKIALGSINFSDDDGWTDGDYKQLQYVSSVKTDDDLTINNGFAEKYVVGTSTNVTYTFSQGYNICGDSTSGVKYGYIDILKTNENYTLEQMVSAEPDAAGTRAVYILMDDVSVSADLGALKRSAGAAASGTPREFTIQSNGENVFTLDGANRKGITVADTTGGKGGAGDTLSFQNLKVKDFDTLVTVKNGGIAKFENVEVVSRKSGTAYDAVVEAGGALNTSGTNVNVSVSNAGTMTVVTGALINGSVTTSGVMTVGGTGSLSNVSLNNSGEVSIAAGAGIDAYSIGNSGNLTSAAGVKAEDSITNNNNGKFNVTGVSAYGVSIAAPTITNNAGEMTAAGHVEAETLDNSGKMTVGGSIEAETLKNNAGATLELTNAESVVEALSVVNAGTLNVKGEFFANSLENSGTLSAADVTANITLNNTGTLGSAANVSSDEVINGANGVITAAGYVSGHELCNSGGITAAGVIADNTLVNGGVITADYVSGYEICNSGSITTDGIIANSAITSSGTLNSTGNVVSENAAFTNSGTAAVGGSLCAASVVNANSGTITVGADKIHAAGGVANNGTLVLKGGAGDDFALLSADVTGSGTAEIRGNVDAYGEGAGKLENALKITEDSALMIAVTSVKNDVTDNSGNLWLAGDGTINYNLAGSGDVTISGSVINQKKIGAGSLVLTEGAVMNNTNTGEISAAVDNSGTILSSADRLTGAELVNRGTVVFGGGTLNGNYKSEGTGAKPAVTQFGAATNFKGSVSLKASMLNFILDDFKAGDTIVSSANTIDLSDTKLRLYQDTEGKKVEELGTKLTLIDNASGYVSDNEGRKYIGADGTEYVVPKKIRVISTDDVLFDYIYDTFLDTTEDSGALILGVVRKASDEETGGDTQTEQQSESQQEQQTAQQYDSASQDTPAPTPVAKEKTKSFNEARLGASAALSAAGDIVAGDVSDNMDTADAAAAGETQGAGGWNAFAAIGGSRGRYNTGSHVDLNSFNAAAGLSRKMNENLKLGVFVEGGNGHYDTVNEFAEGDVTAKGDVSYFGVGAMLKAKGKQTAKGQTHAEVSFRTGRVNSDYTSDNFFSSPGSTRFDTSSSYLGAHAGLGYKWALKDGGKIDTYAQYLWSRQNSDSANILGNSAEFDAINSHRLRAGFRYISTEGRGGFKFYGGLAYEYEFDGKAAGKINGVDIPEPDFKGGSGMAELGAIYKPKNSPWKIDLGMKGFAGKHDGISANLGASYEFDSLAVACESDANSLTFSLRKNIKELQAEKDTLAAENRTLTAENKAKKAEKAKLTAENKELKAKASARPAAAKADENQTVSAQQKQKEIDSQLVVTTEKKAKPAKAGQEQPAKVITTETAKPAQPAAQPKPDARQQRKETGDKIVITLPRDAKPEEQRKSEKIEKPVKPDKKPDAAKPETKRAKPKKGEIEGLGILESPEIANY